MKDTLYTGVKLEYSIYLSISVENIWIFGQIDFSGTNANSLSQVESVHVPFIAYKLKQEHKMVVGFSHT